MDLKQRYLNELVKVRNIFEERRIKKQQELSSLDAMSGGVDDIFKRF